MSRAIELENDNDVFEAPTSKPRGLFQILWQRKAFVLLGAFIGLALGFLYHTQRPTIYESRCELTVIRQPSLNNANNNGNAAIEPDHIPTHISILGSRPLAKRAIEKQKLGELQTFEGSGTPWELLVGNLVVDRDKKFSTTPNNNIIVISYRGPYAEDCQKIVHAIQDGFQDFLEMKFAAGGNQSFELVKKAREALASDLKKSLEKQQKFHEESPIFTNKDGYNTGTDTYLNLEVTWYNDRVKHAKLKARIDHLQKAIATNNPSLDFITEENEEKAANKAETRARYIEEPLIKLRLELNQLMSTHSKDHPTVINKREEIDLLKEKLTEIAPKDSKEKPAERLLKSLSYALDELDATIKATEEKLEEKKNQLRKDRHYEAIERELRGEKNRIEKFLEIIEIQLKQIDLTRTEGGYMANVLNPPGIGVKVAPNALHNLPAGLLLGLLAGVGLAYLADVADKSFRSPEEIRDHLGLPLVGHIPFFKPDPETAAKRDAGESTIEPMLCCYFKPKSLDSEAYRAVRTALFFSTQGQGHKVIQVTSPNKGDGKSLMIANLAITTAQSGKRVLMIDADCRRPRQHKIFNIPNDVGLSSVLTKSAEVRDAIREACVPGLYVMGSGPIPHNPSELLVSTRFKELLDSVRDQYDYVFVDTPPLLAVTDPCIVAGKVDGLFLAIRLTRKGRPDAERAREILQSVNVKVFGIVVNGVTRVTSGLYSSQAYDYTDTYIDDEAEDKDYYYADEDPDEAPKKKDIAKA